jgi:hypothetical protein
MTPKKDADHAGAVGAASGALAAPKTRIASLFIALNSLSAVLLAVAAALGPFVQYRGGLFWFHLTFGLGAAVLGLFSLVSAMFYLVVSGMGLREAVITHKLPVELFERTRKLKSGLFPWCVAGIIVLITMTVLGGGVHVKKIHKYYHLAFSVVTLAVYIGAIRSMKKYYALNGALIAETLAAMDAKKAG